MNKLIATSLATVSMSTAILMSANAIADVSVYGKANLSLQNADEGTSSTTELVSNASRIGFKGSEQLSDNLKAIFQMEFQAHIDDGDGDGQTFTQRNIYVGLQGNWGTLIGGKFDTAMKKTQNSVDLFSDLEADIKSIITVNDNRSSNSIMYTTPKFLDSITASVDFIASETDGVKDGISTSINYDKNDLYLAAAIDQNVEAENVDVIRLVAQYNIDALQLGLLYEDQDATGTSKNTGDGWLVSGQYKLNNGYILKAQLGESDIVTAGGETFSLGVDYRLSSSTKLFGYYSSEDATDATKEAEYVGIGIEMKF